MKLAVTFFAIVLLHGCRTVKNSTASKNLQDSVVLTQRDILKEYAFCQCLRYGYNDEVVSKNDVSISFYNELSLHSIKAQSGIDSIARAIADSI